MDVHPPGRLALIPAAALQVLEDIVPLKGVHGLFQALVLEAEGLGLLDLGEQEVEGNVGLVHDLLVLGQDDRALHEVAQLTDVARPGVALHEADDAGREQLKALLVLGREDLEEVAGQKRDVPAALPQRRQVDGHHAQPVVEVLAEPALLDETLQPLVARRHQPHVHRDILVAADPGDLPLLQSPQELGLQIEA